MKEVPEKHPEFNPETYTDPILEECYRIKAELSAQFKTLEEFSAYLKASTANTPPHDVLQSKSSKAHPHP